jgi:hypothetical protein
VVGYVFYFGIAVLFVTAMGLILGTSLGFTKIILAGAVLRLGVAAWRLMKRWRGLAALPFTDLPQHSGQRGLAPPSRRLAKGASRFAASSKSAGRTLKVNRTIRLPAEGDK